MVHCVTIQVGKERGHALMECETEDQAMSLNIEILDIFQLSERFTGPIPHRARLDSEGTAKPLTRLIHHPNRDFCVGPGISLVNPQYENEEGHRTPLTTR